MNRFRFELATPADDADLRFILAETPMAGDVAVSFRREPSWFDAAVVDGHFRQVVACRNLDSGRLVGFGCRSLRCLHVNGRPEDIGYLSSLRCLAAYRNQGLVARGYAFFRRLHQDGRTPFYLSTIAEGNRKALETLTSQRAGLPAYHLAGRYHTVAIALDRRSRPSGRRQAEIAGVSLRTPGTEDLPALLDLLATAGLRRQFFPCYRREDFLSSEGALRGLNLGCLVLAERAGRPIGLVGAWDQSAYRQSVVHHYSGWVRGLRPVYNAWQWLLGRLPLPAPGRPLRCLNAALPLVADEAPAVFAAMLEELRHRLAGGRWSHLLVGLYESDPLLPVARRLAAACYTSLLYLVSWQDGAGRLRALGNRPLYLELGTL